MKTNSEKNSHFLEAQAYLAHRQFIIIPEDRIILGLSYCNIQFVACRLFFYFLFRFQERQKKDRKDICRSESSEDNLGMSAETAGGPQQV